jgi:hypothetical protein
MNRFNKNEIALVPNLEPHQELKEPITT